MFVIFNTNGTLKHSDAEGRRNEGWGELLKYVVGQHETSHYLLVQVNNTAWNQQQLY